MINKTWNKILEKEFNSDYFKKLLNFVKEEYKIKTVYPHYNDIFNAIKYTDFDKVKVRFIDLALTKRIEGKIKEDGTEGLARVAADPGSHRCVHLGG